MYVNTNVAALDAWQHLFETQRSLSGVLQQLSSGNRINTAADDPAGLAISQQMLTQIDGMQQAYQNAQTGISLLQTADGALGQIQNILQSMRSLASEAATSTMNPNDLANLQSEMDQYSKEITQITNTTQFNNILLLNGSFQSQNIQIGANAGQQLPVTLGAADAQTLGVARNLVDQATATVGTATVSVGTAGATATYTLSTLANGQSSNLAVGNNAYKIAWNGQYSATGAFTSLTVQLEDSSGNLIGSAVTVSAAGSYTIGDTSTGQALSINITSLPGSVTTTTPGTYTETDTVNTASTQPANQSVAGTATNAYQANAVGGLLIMNQTQAQSAITAIDTAINSLSTERANVGAWQNRLQFAASDLQTAQENLQSARAGITNADMALQMSKLAQYQILQQSGVAMLAQADAMPQALLKLLP